MDQETALVEGNVMGDPKILIFPVALDAFTKIPISNFKGNIRKISQNHIKFEEKRVKLC